MPQTSTIARDDRIESLTSSRCERNRALRRLRGPVPINADSADPTQDETYLTDNPAQPLPTKWNKSAMTPNIVSARHHGRSCKAECIINNDISTSGLSDLYASLELARAASSRDRGESAVTHRPEIRLTIVPQVMSGRLKRSRRIAACTGCTITETPRRSSGASAQLLGPPLFRKALPVWKVSFLSSWSK